MTSTEFIALEQSCRQCRACGLCETRQNVVFGTGNPNAEVLFIGEELLLELFSKHPQIAVNYTRFLSERIRFLNGKLGLFTKNDAESRVYEFLRKNSAPCGEVAYTGSMALLARNLGLGRTSLYRALDSLEHKHIITREGGKIKVFCDEKID